tara:strand:- start:822 stop:1400 length:579 start_codon:yes stop_codon:yes gene_type:complete
MDNCGVLIPIKAFDSAKLRLASVLNPSERADLSRSLAEGVIRSCTGAQVWVICEDEEVEKWATTLGAQVIRNPQAGLNEAAKVGLTALAEFGIEKVIVTHADLINPEGITNLFELDGIVLVPDRHNEGTNIVGLPTDIDFSFQYGLNSFEKHKTEAQRFLLPLTIIQDSHLGFDIDNPDDLFEYQLSQEDSL